MPTHFLNIDDWDADKIVSLLNLADRLKAELGAGKQRRDLAGQLLGIVLEKPSTRTRLSFEVAMAQLGGRCITFQGSEIGLNTRESAADVARVFSRQVQAVALRTISHDTIVSFSEASLVPVINGLSDFSHPCQAIADAMTIREYFGKTEGLKLAYLGDGNNVARSLWRIATMLGITFVQSAPEGYDLAALGGVERSAQKAVDGADIVYTDVWASMGQEEEAVKRRAAFAAYQVNDAVMAQAGKHAKFMHCLPAHRGDEVSASVLEGAASIVFDQAENRMHAQKALLLTLMGGQNG